MWACASAFCHSCSLVVEHRSYEPGVAGSIPAWSTDSACSVMVIIGASQALDPGSIPGRRMPGALAQSEECVLCKHEVRGSKPRCSILARARRVFVAWAGFFQPHQAWMAERSKALDSSSSLSWRRGFESHSKHYMGHWSSGMILL